MLYFIEKNIPLPDEIEKRGRKPVYPIEEMEIGDSFFVPFANNKARERTRANINAACSMRGAAKKFRSMTRIENGVSGVRCWRVE